MNYGDYYGPETVCREYKEFTFNHGGLELDHSLAEEMIKSSKWHFNKIVM